MESYLRTIQEDKDQLSKFIQVLLQLFKDYQKKDR